MVVVDDGQVDARLNEIVIWLQVEDVQTGCLVVVVGERVVKTRKARPKRVMRALARKEPPTLAARSRGRGRSPLTQLPILARGSGVAWHVNPSACQPTRPPPVYIHHLVR